VKPRSVKCFRQFWHRLGLAGLAVFAGLRGLPGRALAAGTAAAEMTPGMAAAEVTPGTAAVYGMTSVSEMTSFPPEKPGSLGISGMAAGTGS